MRAKSKLPEGAFRLAYLNCRPQFLDGASNTYPAASKAFYRVVEAFCPKISADPLREYSQHARRQLCRLVPELNQFYPYGVFPTFHTATDEQREALSALFREVQSAMEASYRAGVDHGRDLLTGLTKGEITVAQLNTDSAPRQDDEG